MNTSAALANPARAPETLATFARRARRAPQDYVPKTSSSHGENTMSTMAAPTTMRHIAVRAPGPPDVMTLTEGPVPSPRAGEVLIEVAWAGVNRPDCAQRAGTYPPPPDASPILGLEISGRIV